MLLIVQVKAHGSLSCYRTAKWSFYGGYRVMMYSVPLWTRFELEKQVATNYYV